MKSRLIVLATLIIPMSVVADPPTPDPHFGAVEAFRAPDEATEAGVAWERVLFWWHHLQPHGPNDWNPHFFPDGVLNEERARGRTLVGLLINTPDWANGGRGPRVPPDGLYLPYWDPKNHWGQFVYRIVSMYKGRIDHWVMWNEPDVWDAEHSGYTWAGTVEDYYQLLKVGYLAAKSANPDCVVFVAATTYWWDKEYGRPLYFAQLLDVIAQDPTAPEHNYYFDAVPMHLYFKPQSLYDVPRLYHQLMQQHGFDKPIWINEMNAPPFDDPATPVEHPRFAVTMDQQASFIIQGIALGLASEAERIAVYKMIDPADLPANGEPYGLVRRDKSPRPAFAAYQVATTHFAGVREASYRRFGEVQQVVIDRGNRTTRVLWTTSRRAARVTVPTIADEALVVDKAGRARPIAAKNGRYVLTLDGAACAPKAECFIGGSPLLLVENGTASTAVEAGVKVMGARSEKPRGSNQERWR